MSKKQKTKIKESAPRSMEELLAMLPNAGIPQGKVSYEEAEAEANHPETWIPVVLTKRGRPRRGQETGSEIRSIRFPNEIWTLLDEKAKRTDMALHAAMRKVLLEWALAADDSITTATLVGGSLPIVTVESPYASGSTGTKVMPLIPKQLTNTMADESDESAIEKKFK